MKNVVLLGATGSIGSSTLNVLRQNKEIFTLKAIALHQNLDIALEIVNEFSPEHVFISNKDINTCLLYTSPSPRDRTRSRMPSSA